MQSGGYGGRGVHESGWQYGYWTHFALQMSVSYDEPPEPPEPPYPPDPPPEPEPPNPPDPDEPDEDDPDDPPPPTPPDTYIMLPYWCTRYKTRKELKPPWRTI